MENLEFNTIQEKKQSAEAGFLNRLKSVAVLGALLGLTACNTNKIHEKIEDQPSASIPYPEAGVRREVTAAEMILHNFPKDIPGASKNVMIENAEDAKKVMIVLNQNHLLPLEGRKKEPSAADLYWELHMVNASQKDNVRALQYFGETWGVKKVYTEGESEKTIGDTGKALSGELRVETFSALNSEAIREYYNQMVKKTPEFPVSFDTLCAQFPYSIGAPYVLHTNGKMDIAPAEDSLIMEKMTTEHHSLTLSFHSNSEGHMLEHSLPKEKRDAWNLVFHQREEYLLKQVSQDTNTVSVAHFGGTHYWGDNVSSWNVKNPEKKIGLVVLNPASRNESFASFLILNSGFTSEQGSWIEFHFRDHIQKIETDRIDSEVLFEKGVQEMTKMKKSNGLSAKEITLAIEVMRQATKDKIEGLHDIKK